MKKNNKKRNGFTLIEILLVIGVIMIMSIIKIRDINEETEDMQAKMLAEQIQTVSDATNAFLVLKYNELSTLSSTGVSCNTGANTCNITLQNLNDNALLPPNFSSTTILGQPYEIQLKRTGSSPNYMMAGLVLTKGVKNTENKISFIFSGKVLRKIGRDGGLNKNKGNIIGASGGWSADSNLFPVLSDKVNYIGSAVGTLSGAYYVYLRRDGTLPMTGDLNMDGHNIKNVNHINAGSINTTGEITIGSNLSVKETINTASLYGSYIKSSGNIDSNGNISGNAIYGNYIKANGSIEASSNISGKDVKASGNIDASGNVTGNAVYGNYIKSKGRIAADEFIYINAQAGIGGGCAPNGLQGRSPEGALLSCVNGVWSSNGLKIGFFSVTSPVGVTNITWARYCALGHYGKGGGTQVYPVAGPDGEGKYLWQTNTTGGAVTINCF